MKKFNFLLIGASSLALVASPLLTMLAQRSPTSRGDKIETDGFNIATPQIAQHDPNLALQQIVFGSFFDKQGIVPYDSMIEESNVAIGVTKPGRVSKNSKTYIHDEKFTINFYKTAVKIDSNGNSVIDNLEPTAIIASGLLESGNSITKTVLATGTGIPWTIENTTQGVVSSQLVGDTLWLLTHGTFGNPAVEDKYILQTFNVQAASGNPTFIPIGNSSVINFTGDAAARLSATPPVLSPVYLTASNGDISIDPNSMIVWQQNLPFDEVSGVAQKFSINDLTNPQPFIIGMLPTNGNVLALTAMVDANGKNHSYVHHTTPGIDVVNLSSFSEDMPGIPTNTIELLNNINTTGIEINNQMSYAKVAKSSNTTAELVYLLPQTTTNTNSTIFLSTIKNQVIIDTIATNPSNDINNIEKVEYTKLGSFENDNALLSLKIGKLDETQPTLFSLSKLKAGFPDNPLSKINFAGKGEFSVAATLNATEIWKFDDKNVTFLFNIRGNVGQQDRNFDDVLKNPVYNTVTPTEIIELITPSTPKFDLETPIDSLNLFVGDTTNNVVSLNAYNGRGPLSRPIDIIDWEFRKATSSFDVVYRYKYGQYINNGEFLEAPDKSLYLGQEGDGIINTLPKVAQGVSPFQKISLFQEEINSPIPLILSVNTNLINDMSKSAPDDFANHINSVTGESGGVPLNFQNNENFNNIIGFKSTDLIQISQAYLPSLRRVIVQPNNFSGTASVELVFNPGLKPEFDILLNILVDGFFGTDLIVIITVPIAIVLIALILLIIFLVLAKKKKNQLSKSLSAGFSLAKKMASVNTPTSSAILDVKTGQVEGSQQENTRLSSGSPSQQAMGGRPYPGSPSQQAMGGRPYPGSPSQQAMGGRPSSGSPSQQAMGGRPSSGSHKNSQPGSRNKPLGQK